MADTWFEFDIYSTVHGPLNKEPKGEGSYSTTYGNTTEEDRVEKVKFSVPLAITETNSYYIE